MKTFSIELTEEEAAELKFSLECSRIDAKGLSAVGFEKQKKRIRNIESIMAKLNKAKAVADKSVDEVDYER